jgi:uncharacterized protein YaaQ
LNIKNQEPTNDRIALYGRSSVAAACIEIGRTMKLVIAVVQRQDAGELLEALTSQGHRVTRISSEGGFLREGNVTLLIAVEDQAVEPLLRSVREHCYTRTRYVSPLPPVAESGEFYPPVPVEVQVGGATIFVLKTDTVARL